MTIVQADPTHAGVVAPLFDAYRQFYRQPTDVNRAESFLKERLKNGESVIFLALGEKNQGLGFVQLYPIFSSVSMKRVWLLNDLFVTTEARRQGVAKALMERAKKLASDAGAKGLLLETEVTNKTAQALYDSLGYVRNQETYFYFLNVERS